MADATVSPGPEYITFAPVENTWSRPAPRETPTSRRSAGGRRGPSGRERVLRTVEQQPEPATTAAICRETGLHENTVRGHLEQLLADGHVTRSRAAALGRGRPAWLWRPTENGPASPYVALATSLADSLARTSPDPAVAAREAGRAWGQEMAQDVPQQSPPATARELSVHAMSQQGFDPEDTDDAIVLHHCPLLSAAARHPEVVCSVHRGMVDGLLEGTGHLHAGVELVPFAAPGQCHLHVDTRA